MQTFADGKAIFGSASTGAHEVHGLIAQTYKATGKDASCLGLPMSDEEANGDGRDTIRQDIRNQVQID
jgi:uncharacterized protein with LGFP repeats